MSIESMDINNIAMGVILNAGDARMCIDEAMDAMTSMDFDLVDAKIAEADAKILKPIKRRPKRFSDRPPVRMLSIPCCSRTRRTRL